MHKNKARTKIGPKQAENSWDGLICRAEDKLRRIRRRSAQLEALILDFRRKRDSGDPTPFDVAKTGRVAVSGN
jgi:hypothetical protein